MLISHRYKFIFFECPKTASTSLRETLVDILNNDGNGSYTKQTHLKENIDILNDDWAGTDGEHDEWYTHIRPLEARHKLCRYGFSDENWQKYFKFSFVREPIDREISRFKYHINSRLTKMKNESDINNFIIDASNMNLLEWVKKHPILPQHEWIIPHSDRDKNTIFFDWKYYIEMYPDLQENGITTQQAAIDHWLVNGRYEGRKADTGVLDFVGRFEDLNNSFKTICNYIGIPYQKLLHKNKSTSKNVEIILNDTTVDYIRSYFKEDYSNYYPNY